MFGFKVTFKIYFEMKLIVFNVRSVCPTNFQTLDVIDPALYRSQQSNRDCPTAKDKKTKG